MTINYASVTEPWHESRIRELTAERDEANRRLQASDELLVKSLDERDEARKAVATYSDCIERLRAAIDTGTAWRADQVVDQAIAMLGDAQELAARRYADIETLECKLEAIKGELHEERARASRYSGLLDVEALARIDWAAYSAIDASAEGYDDMSPRYQNALKAGAEAVAQAITFALVSDAAVEAAAKADWEWDGSVWVDVAPSVADRRRERTRKGIQAALKVALAEPVVTTEPKQSAYSCPMPTEYIDRWADGRPNGGAEHDAECIRTALAWLVRRELARTGEPK